MDDSSKSRVTRDTELARNLGQIRVRVWRAVDLHTRSLPHTVTRSPFTGQLAEKALKGKAISHSTM